MISWTSFSISKKHVVIRDKLYTFAINCTKNIYSLMNSKLHGIEFSNASKRNYNVCYLIGTGNILKVWQNAKKDVMLV